MSRLISRLVPGRIRVASWYLREAEEETEKSKDGPTLLYNTFIDRFGSRVNELPRPVYNAFRKLADQIPDVPGKGFDLDVAGALKIAEDLTVDKAIEMGRRPLQETAPGFLVPKTMPSIKVLKGIGFKDMEQLVAFIVLKGFVEAFGRSLVFKMEGGLPDEANQAERGLNDVIQRFSIPTTSSTPELNKAYKDIVQKFMGVTIPGEYKRSVKEGPKKEEGPKEETEGIKDLKKLWVDYGYIFKPDTTQLRSLVRALKKDQGMGPFANEKVWVSGYDAWLSALEKFEEGERSDIVSRLSVRIKDAAGKRPVEKSVIPEEEAPAEPESFTQGDELKEAHTLFLSMSPEQKKDLLKMQMDQESLDSKVFGSGESWPRTYKKFMGIVLKTSDPNAMAKELNYNVKIVLRQRKKEEGSPKK